MTAYPGRPDPGIGFGVESTDNTAATGRLGQLVQPYLYDNPLTSLAGLAGLTNLKSLEMSEINTLTNFDALAQLTALQSLDAESCGLSDLAPLATLANLNSLYLDDDDVGDIEPLGNLTNLTYLYLEENVLTSIAPLTNLPSLYYLDARYNLIDFQPRWHSANDLQFLENEVDWVYYEPQYSPLPQFGIVVQPADQTVAAGSTATFSVTVSSSISPLQYQWQFQDAPLPGQTANTLTLPGVQTNQAGRYRVQVTDNTVSGWHIYSRSAQLVVQGGGGPTAPDLTVTGSVGLSPNRAGAGVNLTVSYTVFNQGNGDAPVSQTLVQVNPVSGGASAAGVVHPTPAITAGSSLTENVTVPIPASTPVGAYTVYVTLDYDDAIGQSDTDNDTAQTAIGLDHHAPLDARGGRQCAKPHLHHRRRRALVCRIHQHLQWLRGRSSERRHWLQPGILAFNHHHWSGHALLLVERGS